MSNSEKKNKRKINVIDVVIILLVLALVGTAGYRIYTEVTKNASSRQSNQILTFECEVTYANVIKYMKVGDAVYLSSDGTLLGYIYEADDSKGAVYVLENEGEDSASNVGVNKTVRLRGTLKLSADAIKAKNGGYYVINGKNITKGGTFSVYTEKAVMKITVKDITDSKQK